MCVTIDTNEKNFSCFDHFEYKREVELMRKRMEKLLSKVEKNESKVALLDKGYNFQQFKESLRESNENLKK